MKRFFAIIVIFVICVLCALLSSCGIDAPFAEKKTESGASPATSVIGAASTAAPTASRTAAASTAAPSSAAPTTLSPSPAASTAAPSSAVPTSGAPVTAPATAAPASSQSGKPAPIQLRLSYGIEPFDDDLFFLHVDVILDCYDISIGSPRKGSVTFNGETRSFVTEGFTIEGAGRNSFVLHSDNFVVSPDTVGQDGLPLSAEWNFRGSYGGQTIDVLSAEETVTMDAAH